MTTINQDIIRTVPNRFSKKCCICEELVETSQGYACQSKEGWSTYCAKHVPVKIQPPRAEITKDGEVFFPYDPNAVVLIKSLAGARFNSEGKFWTISIEPDNLDRAIDVAQSLGLKVAPELLRQNELTQRQTQEEIQEDFAVEGLFPFQVEGSRFIATKKRCLLGDEMGTGKTIQTLATISKDVGTLVVCPASLKFNWREEANKWRPDLEVVVLKGRNSFRFPNVGEIVIVNYDILPQKIENKNTQPFNLVCDEIHLCKNYKTKRTKAVTALSRIANKVVGLTGTPLMNRPFDLYGVLSAMQLEREVFGGWQGFLRAFGGYRSEWGGYEFSGPSPIVPELLRRVMLRRKREEVLPDLPKKSYSKIVVNGISKKLKNQLDSLYDEYGILINNNELPPFEEFAEIRAKLAESRTDAMIEIVESHEEEDIPLVVFSAHRYPIDELGKREGWATITGSTKPEHRQEIVNQFQSGKLKGVGLTISAGGVGLTLTKAWKAVFVDLDWTPALNAQAEDRICRIGQTKPCEIVRMVSDHVLDKHVNQLISEKIQLFNDAIDSSVSANKFEFIEGETDEQFAERMSLLQDELDSLEQNKKETLEKENKEKAKNKVQQIIEREKNRSGSKELKLPELTDVLIESIKQNLEKMLICCDGAKERDNMGFNKPDAMLSRWLYAAGLDEPDTLYAAYLMLLRYPRQVRLKN